MLKSQLKFQQLHFQSVGHRDGPALFVSVLAFVSGEYNDLLIKLGVLPFQVVD